MGEASGTWGTPWRSAPPTGLLPAGQCSLVSVRQVLSPPHYIWWCRYIIEEKFNVIKIQLKISTNNIFL